MDAHTDLPENLPAIAEDRLFNFACGPERECFNKCCRELFLPLTPYDVLRLAGRLGLKSREFLERHTNFAQDSQTGFPECVLRMLPDERCPFVRQEGCAVYDSRPSACRCYPLGRGASLARRGIAQRFFLLREKHCLGFASDICQTPLEWLRRQGMGRYIYYNDRYMRLLSLVKAGGEPVDAKMGAFARFCLFQADEFKNYALVLRIFEHPALAGQNYQALLAQKGPNGREAVLDLALDWLEVLLFGQKIALPA